MENEIEIEERVYRINSMNVFTQFHVARRLSTLAPAILNHLQTPIDERNNLVLFYAMTDAFSTIAEDDANYVLTHCMAVVMRKQETGWAKIQTDGGLMFEDINLPVMLKIVWEVLLKDIASFFPTAPQISDEVKQPT